MRVAIRTYSFALAATLAATGAFTISAAVVTAPEAEAFGLGDVWKGAKKVGKTAAKVGKGAYDASRELDKAVRRGTAEAVGTVTGEFVGQVGGRLYEGIRHGRAPTKEQLDRARRGTKDFVTGAQDRLERGIDRERRNVGDTIKEAGGAIRDTAKDIANGLVRVGKPPAVTPPRAPAQPGWGRPVGQLRTTLRAPVKGITRKDVGIKQSAKGALGNDRSIYGRPVGTKTGKTDRARKRPLGNDRSIWGRPVGVKGPKGKQIGNDRSIHGRPVFAPPKRGSRAKAPGRTVQGITQQNLKPARKVGRNVAKETKLRRGNDRKRRDMRMAGGSKKKTRNNRRRNGRGRRR